jgi:ketosteroid isomerase-like protein
VSTDGSGLTDDAEAVVAAFGRACNEHDLAAALQFCSTDFVFESTLPPDGDRAVGHDGARRIWEPIFADPATHVDVEETIVAGDRVVQRCVYGWGDGHVRAIDLYRVTDGKIVEKLSYVKG